MRAIWLQTSRPSLNGAPARRAVNDILHSSKRSTLRRRTTAPLRRRLTFNDAFTVLLAPVLATAFIADTSWKEKQRKDWDEKLATVQREIEEIQARERELSWNALQSRLLDHGAAQLVHPPPHPTHPARVGHQRRGYLTVTTARLIDDAVRNQVRTVSSGKQQHSTLAGDIEDEGDDDLIWKRESMDAEEGTHSLSAHSDAYVYSLANARNAPTKDLRYFCSVQRLIAVQLSIALLIQCQLGRNPRYGLFESYDGMERAAGDPDSIPTDASTLLRMLHNVRKELAENDWPVHEPHLLATAANEQAAGSHFHRHVLSLISRVNEGDMSIEALIANFALGLLRSDDFPSMELYTQLLRVVSQSQEQQSLCYHIVKAMKECRLPVGDNDLFHMLYQFGLFRDGYSFSKMLRQLPGHDEHMFITSQWQMTSINGLELPVPTSLRPRMLKVLVWAAIRCHQPHRSEAWVPLLEEGDLGGSERDHLIKCHLFYYAQERDWERGKKWLHRGIRHATTIAQYGYGRLQRLILRMLDFCVACRRLPDYTKIISAAVESGILPPPIQKHRPKRYSPRARSVLLEWEHLAGGSSSNSDRRGKYPGESRPLSSSLVEATDIQTNLEKVKRFQARCADLLEDGPGPMLEQDFVLKRSQGHYQAYSLASVDAPAGTAATSTKRPEQASSRQETASNSSGDHVGERDPVTAALYEQLVQSRDAISKLHTSNALYAQQQEELKDEVAQLRSITQKLIEQLSHVKGPPAPEGESPPPADARQSAHPASKPVPWLPLFSKRSRTPPPSYEESLDSSSQVDGEIHPATPQSQSQSPITQNGIHQDQRGNVGRKSFRRVSFDKYPEEANHTVSAG